MSLVLVPQVRSLKFREQQSRHELAQLMLVKWGASSDTGTLRVQNEDSFLAEEKIFVVADGMGGHNAGEVASAMAIKMLAEAQANGISDSSQLAKVIEQINHSIFQAAANQTDQRGMGTTLAVLAFFTALHARTRSPRWQGSLAVSCLECALGAPPPSAR